LEEDRKRLGLPEDDSETVNDWMSRFTKKTEIKVTIENETIDSEGFAKKFTKKPEDIPTTKKITPSKFLIEKAGSSLDKSIVSDTLDDIVELAEDFTTNKKIHPNNIKLHENDDFESRISKLKQDKKSDSSD
jgi:hypothetical protein